jgi:hypothetical protein
MPLFPREQFSLESPEDPCRLAAALSHFVRPWEPMDVWFEGPPLSEFEGTVTSDGFYLRPVVFGLFRWQRLGLFGRCDFLRIRGRFLPALNGTTIEVSIGLSWMQYVALAPWLIMTGGLGIIGLYSALTADPRAFIILPLVVLMGWLPHFCVHIPFRPEAAKIRRDLTTLLTDP